VDLAAPSEARSCIVSTRRASVLRSRSRNICDPRGVVSSGRTSLAQRAQEN
jgi:hypothetical protein